MATSPDETRTALVAVTAAAATELQTTAATGSSLAEVEAILFLAAPVIVSDYTDAAAALALDWYEELREIADPLRPFAPLPVTNVTDELVKSIVANVLKGVGSGQGDISVQIDAAVTILGDRFEELVAEGFRDTVTENTLSDPNAVGWRRFARPGACGFCRMLADKGAIFTERTARFAAHGAVMRGGRKGGNCRCIAAPEFGSLDDYIEATPLQYVASKRKRSDKERARLREYLRDNFPDSGADSETGGRSHKTPDMPSETPVSAFDAMTLAQVENQIRILENLPDSEYKRKQLPRLRRRLAELR